MKRLLGLVAGLWLFSPAFAQNAADAYYDPDVMQAARDALHQSHGGAVNWMVFGERLEYDIDDDAILVWEGQGWIGSDINKAWFKTEGEFGDDFDGFEVQALYSRAIASFWEFQAGVRYDIEPDPSLAHGVVGIQGLAPYWFELDAALFLNEDGDLTARLEAEYDFRLAQRVVLQPRLELNGALTDVQARGIGAGLATSEFGLRLRYEFRRSFAPYLGVSWSRAHGDSRDLVEDPDRNSVVLGLRFWF